MISIDLDRIASELRNISGSLLEITTARCSSVEYSTNSDGEPTTRADLIMDQKLNGFLTSYLCGSGYLSEESWPTKIADNLNEWTWLVDPLDGTRAYIEHSDCYGVIITLLKNTEAVCGWLYQPALDRLAYGERGAGVRSHGMPAKSTLENTSSYIRVGARRSTDCASFSCDDTNIVIQLDPPSSCVDYLDLLSGTVQGAIYFKVRPWDHMAGTLLLCEAGFQTRGRASLTEPYCDWLLHADNSDLMRCMEAFKQDRLEGSQPTIPGK